MDDGEYLTLDEREALAEDGLTETIARLIQQFEGDPEEWRNFRDAANAILASEVWRNRRQGPITDAARAWAEFDALAGQIDNLERSGAAALPVFHQRTRRIRARAEAARDA